MGNYCGDCTVHLTFSLLHSEIKQATSGPVEDIIIDGMITLSRWLAKGNTIVRRGHPGYFCMLMFFVDIPWLTDFKRKISHPGKNLPDDGLQSLRDKAINGSDYIWHKHTHTQLIRSCTVCLRQDCFTRQSSKGLIC